MTMTTKPIDWFWQAWLASVVFLFPIPHTIALRNLLLLIGLLTLLATRRKASKLSWPPLLRPAAWGFAATTVWLALQSVAVAPAPTLALDNLRGDWILPLLTAALAAHAGGRLEARLAIRAVVSALLAHMIWVLGWQLSLWVGAGMSGPWPARLGSVPFGEADYQSGLNGFLFALLLAERIAVMFGGAQVALFTGKKGWPALAVTVIADVALRMRNGTAVNLALLVAVILHLARRQPRVILVLIAVASLAGASATLDPRWSGLQESVGIGWSSPGSYWLIGSQTSRPLTPSGVQIEESAYLRTAWAHQALQAIAEHPLGLGFGRDAFGRAIEMKYGYKGMVSSHSGWLDFALAAGIPGLALLLLTAALAIRGGWRQFREHEDAAGLMFCFLVGSYMLRCLLDGHMSGWRLGLFAFICGVLIAAMKRPPQTA
jgi:hypothetical protein